MLLAIEGIDGSGKSTLLRALARRLRRDGHRVLVTQEPTRSWLGRAVRKGIRSQADPLALAALFLADRAQHVATLRPHLEKGEVVLTDRYVHSTTAYQAAVLGKRWPDALERLQRLQAALFPAPDRVVWLDLPPREAVRRLAHRRVKEPFERERFLARVRANYARLARQESRRWIRLDATIDASTVAQRAYERLNL